VRRRAAVCCRRAARPETPRAARLQTPNSGRTSGILLPAASLRTRPGSSSFPRTRAVGPDSPANRRNFVSRTYQPILYGQITDWLKQPPAISCVRGTARCYVCARHVNHHTRLYRHVTCLRGNYCSLRPLECSATFPSRSIMWEAAYTCPSLVAFASRPNAAMVSARRRWGRPVPTAAM
jgi:hypothetical protein